MISDPVIFWMAIVSLVVNTLALALGLFRRRGDRLIAPQTLSPLGMVLMSAAYLVPVPKYAQGALFLSALVLAVWSFRMTMAAPPWRKPATIRQRND